MTQKVFRSLNVCNDVGKFQRWADSNCSMNGPTGHGRKAMPLYETCITERPNNGMQLTALRAAADAER